MSSSSWMTTRSLGGQVVVVEQPAHRAAGLVHVGQRAGQHHAPAGQPPLTGDRARAGALARRQPDAGPGGELVEHHRADVVPVAGVPGPGVAEPDDRNGPSEPASARRGGAGSAGAPAGRAVGQRMPQARQRTSRPESIDSPLPSACGSGGAVAVGVGLLALDAGLGLGLGQLGLERLGGRGAQEADDQRLGVGDQRRAARAGRGRRR